VAGFHLMLFAFVYADRSFLLCGFAPPRLNKSNSLFLSSKLQSRLCNKRREKTIQNMNMKTPAVRRIAVPLCFTPHLLQERE
jgi:hypothetical protein